jgi:hypothetical protein
MKINELAKTLNVKSFEVLKMAKTLGINVELVTDDLDEDQVNTLEQVFTLESNNITKFIGLRKDSLTGKFEIVVVELSDLELNKLNPVKKGDYKNVYYAKPNFLVEMNNLGIFNEKTYN